MKSEIQPACAAAPERSAIATGPINCLTEVSRVNRPASVSTICRDHSQFFSALSFTASTAPGIDGPTSKGVICAPTIN